MELLKIEVRRQKVTSQSTWEIGSIVMKDVLRWLYTFRYKRDFLAVVSVSGSEIARLRHFSELRETVIDFLEFR